MNSDQIGGLARLLGGVLAGFLLSHGLIPSSGLDVITTDATLAISGIVALGVGIWTVRKNSTTALIASVADKPEVTSVNVTPATALAIQHAKVSSRL